LLTFSLIYQRFERFEPTSSLFLYYQAPSLNQAHIPFSS